MGHSGWFNDNRHRCFPFKLNSVGKPIDGPITLENLPDAVIVDCGFLLGVRSGFNVATHKIYLQEIRRSGTTFTFRFESDAPNLAGVPLEFTRDVADAVYVSEQQDSGETGISLSDSSGIECAEPIWSGFLTTGDMEVLAAFLSGNGVIVRGSSDAVVESALMQSLADGSVESLNLANDDRTRVTAHEDCDDIVWPYPIGVIFVYDRCLNGDVYFKPGYNATIRQNVIDNSITFGAAVGQGAGQPCNETPLFDGETAPDGSNLLSGGLRCNDVLRSINGVGGRLFTLETDGGVTVTSSPDDNRLVVDVDMSGLAICFNGVSQVSETL